MTDLDDIKKRARKGAGDLRKVAHGMLPDAGERLRNYVVTWFENSGLGASPKIVSGYWPIGSEIDPLPALEMLLAMGHDTCLPVVIEPDAPLIFRRWRPGDALEPGGFGTSVPLGDAEQVTPDILIVPLLSFDEAGYRLGYGGGFYDRTISKLTESGSVATMGVAYSAQRVDTVPVGPFDKALDIIITEVGIGGGKQTKDAL